MGDRRRRRSVSGQFANLLPLAGLWLVALSALVAAGLQRHAPVEELFLDPAAVAGVAWYTGMLSNAGILAWTVAATAAGGGGWLAARLGRRPAAAFLATGSALTTVLLVDDLLQLHAQLLPSLGVAKPTAQLLIVAPAPLWAWVHRHEIARTRWLLLVAALAGFGVSLLADQWPLTPASPTMSAMIEDGAKLLGLLAWAQYFVLTTVDIARSATDDALARAAGDESHRTRVSREHPTTPVAQGKASSTMVP